MLFKPVMARVGIKRDKDGIYPDRNCVTSVRPPDYQPKRGAPCSADSQDTAGHAQGPTSPPNAGHRQPATTARRRCAVALNTLSNGRRRG